MFDAYAKLLEGMYALTQSEPALFTNDPEALLYGGLPPWAFSARLKPRLVKVNISRRRFPEPNNSS